MCHFSGHAPLPLYLSLFAGISARDCRLLPVFPRAAAKNGISGCFGQQWAGTLLIFRPFLPADVRLPCKICFLPQKSPAAGNPGQKKASLRRICTPFAHRKQKKRPFPDVSGSNGHLHCGAFMPQPPQNARFQTFFRFPLYILEKIVYNGIIYIDSEVVLWN